MYPWYSGLLFLQAASLAWSTAVPRGAQDTIHQDLDKVAKLAKTALQEAQSLVESSGSHSNGPQSAATCTWSKVKIRREWGSLSSSQKEAYISAVKCLQSKPAKYPASVAPGAKSRFDDFVATHINQTQTIHYTGNFLSWHRYYTWVYEEALRTECGYTGTQPYWDWSLSAISGLANSPIFDGSATSLSGNGVFIPDQADIVLGVSLGLPAIYLPPGTGGGCVTSGPFVNMSVNLGPAALDLPGGISETNPDGPLSFNPRCLKRSLTDYCNQKFANASSVLTLLTQPQDIVTFQNLMQGIPGVGNIGVHGGGHYSLGGDPGRDVFTSPGDPVFYLHHAMIDRSWWIWQMLSPQERQFGPGSVGGTRTFLNNPPSANTSLEDIVDFSYAGGSPRKLKDLMSTTGGPFCYVYV